MSGQQLHGRPDERLGAGARASGLLVGWLNWGCDGGNSGSMGKRGSGEAGNGWGRARGLAGWWLGGKAATVGTTAARANGRAGGGERAG